MKPFTKEVLGRCTDVVQEHGLSRKRRGFCVWPLSSEVHGAIQLQHRDFPDGTVQIDTYPQVYWEPVERLYSAGLNARYRDFEHPTQSRMWSFINFSEPELIFEPGADNTKELARLSRHIEKHVVEKVLELAGPEEILKFYLNELPSGGHNPERYLCIRAWMKRTLNLDDEFEFAIGLLDHVELMHGFGIFYDQLRNSDVVKKLLSGDRT